MQVDVSEGPENLSGFFDDMFKQRSAFAAATPRFAVYDL
jgi:hypothetical protein